MKVKDVFGGLPTLETEQLLLRKIEPDDLESIFEYASDPEVARYTSWDAHSSIEDSRGFLDYVLDLYERRQVAPWGVVHKGDDKLIGTCGFFYWDLHNARTEIGYALSQILEPGFDDRGRSPRYRLWL